MRNRVKEFLERQGKSAYALIKETGIAPATGYKLARDSRHLPSIHVLKVLCDTYEVQPNEFVIWVGEDV